jgi:hypothetical protein
MSNNNKNTDSKNTDGNYVTQSGREVRKTGKRDISGGLA